MYKKINVKIDNKCKRGGKERELVAGNNNNIVAEFI